MAEYEVGQEIYIGESWGWNGQRYTRCKISKVTPAGQIKTRLNDAEWIFNPDGRERGRGYRGRWIDSEMSLAERAAWIKRENAKSAAITILRKLDLNPKAESAAYLKEFVAEVQSKLEEAKKLLEAA